MTSLPKVQVTGQVKHSIDLTRDSDLHMCATSLVHTCKPNTTLKYAKMIYSIRNVELKPTQKHGHLYITPVWRVRAEYQRPKTQQKPGDPVQRIRSILLAYLSPASLQSVRVLLSNPDLLDHNP